MEWSLDQGCEGYRSASLEKKKKKHGRAVSTRKHDRAGCSVYPRMRPGGVGSERESKKVQEKEHETNNPIRTEV